MTTSAATAAGSELVARLLPIADLYRGRTGAAIPLLADMQKEMGYISPEAVDFMARELDIPVNPWRLQNEVWRFLERSSEDAARTWLPLAGELGFATPRT